jgi:flagellar hook-basal body complex protein FliE
MISGIGKGDSLARNAIEAALARQADALREMQQKASGLGAPGAEGAKPGGFGSALAEGLGAVDAQAKQVERLHVDVLQGKLDVHEAAAQIQQSKLAFDFAMQVRDRFVDAYREVMRMSV